MKTRLVALCAIALAVGATLSAQTPPLAQGARVRVTQLAADGYWAVNGRVLRLRPDTVTIALFYPQGRVRAFALDGSWRLETAVTGVRHVGRRVLWGAGIGAVVMAAIAAASFEPCVPREFGSCWFAPENAAQAAGWGAFGGAVLGGAFGLVLGLLTRDVHWIPMRADGLSVGVASRSDGRPALGAALSL